ncbi:MAG: alpha/beta fold hydrolase [Spirochaetales bacterium]|jgi:carboxylesterase|nr:alpha/beta fold hydrolase [Spirochaetales bacterium]
MKYIPAAAHTDSSSLPIFLSGGDEAFLLIHGFTDVSDQLRYMAERLWERGYTVSVPRLPGHGTCGEDFLQTSWKDWLRRAADEFFDLRCRYETVHLLGVSMGGLIAIILASRFQTGKLVLAAPAIVTSSRSLWFSRFLRLFVKKSLRKNYSFSGLLEHSFVSREYWRWNWPGPVSGIPRLKKMARKLLPSVKAETFVIVSEKDGTVPIEAADFIEKRIGTRRISRLVLKESGHIVLDGHEREKAADAVLRWLSDSAESDGCEN